MKEMSHLERAQDYVAREAYEQATAHALIAIAEILAARHG